MERYKKLQLPVHHVDASAAFLDRLAGVTDPEQKRKIIGKTFIDTFNDKAQQLGEFDFPRAGHAVSGRDRIGVGARALGDDQESSTSAACRRA